MTILCCVIGNCRTRNCAVRIMRRLNIPLKLPSLDILAEHMALVYKDLAWLLEQYANIKSPVTRNRQPTTFRSNMT